MKLLKSSKANNTGFLLAFFKIYYPASRDLLLTIFLYHWVVVRRLRFSNFSPNRFILVDFSQISFVPPYISPVFTAIESDKTGNQRKEEKISV